MNNVVDTSAWLEYLGSTKNGEKYAPIIENKNWLIIPSIVIFEIYKKLLSYSDEESALLVISTIKSHATIVDFDEELAILAANLQKEHNLPMADSIILATTRFFKATLWTQDSDFRNIEDVKYFPKK